MRIVRRLEYHPGSREEKMDWTQDFPYQASRALLDEYRDPFVPWHWHGAFELFYVESGEVTYQTPGGVTRVPAGWAGLVNANVLHSTSIRPKLAPNVQLIHLFEPRLLAGDCGAIGEKYLRPVTDSAAELLTFAPHQPGGPELIRRIRDAFALQEGAWGYELEVRQALSGIWLQMLRLCGPALPGRPPAAARTADKVKQMMAYIQQHYPEPITAAGLAGAVYLSERGCYRAFRTQLHMTPAAYLRQTRIRAACRLLAETQAPVTEIGYACGLGSPSHFGQIFRAAIGCTPLQYRRKWQDPDKK